MKDAMQVFLEAAKLPKHNLPASSRYYPIGTALMESVGGENIIYLKRRFIPPPDYYFSLQKHWVKERERIDNITAQYLGDPEQFWQFADANAAMRAEELAEEQGRSLRVPQGFGFSGI